MKIVWGARGGKGVAEKERRVRCGLMSEGACRGLGCTWVWLTKSMFTDSYSSFYLSSDLFFNSIEME